MTKNRLTEDDRAKATEISLNLQRQVEAAGGNSTHAAALAKDVYERTLWAINQEKVTKAE